MSTWPTDEMIDAVQDTVEDHTGFMVMANAAAEVAGDVMRCAPTVDGWVWCESRQWFTAYTPADEPRHGGACEAEDGGAVYGCPGPHRTLIIGPEVDR